MPQATRRATSRTLRIETPRIFAPLLNPSRYKGAYGGRGSAKSHTFAELLIERCMLRQTRAVCIREFQKSLEHSVKKLLEDKIKRFDLGDSFRIMNTHIDAPHDGIIIFEGMQAHTKDSIKSLERFDVAYVEEAQTLSQSSLDMLRPTIRAENSELWFAWNPRKPTDPVDDLFRGNAPRKEGDMPWKPLPDSILVKSNYSDNPWFPDVLKAEVTWDRMRDPDKYLHVWGGDYERRSEARVFKNWRVEEFDTPSDAAFMLGADWGFSTDPAVLVRNFAKPIPSTSRYTLFIDDEAYQVGCEIDHLPELFDKVGAAHGQRGMARNWVSVADSARPETISYMKRHGYPRMEAAIKGANSVKEGVIFLQGMDIVVHPRCVHTIDELTAYSYKVDKLTGNVLPVLEDKKNHVIDSLRYSIEKLRAGAPFTQVSTSW